MVITEEQFTAAMRAAVEERGADYVYPAWSGDGPDDYHNIDGTCQYRTPDGTPACIVGLALSKINPDLVPGYGTNLGADNLLAGKAEDGVRDAARFAQEVQDEEGTWGEALEAYLDAIGEES